jgi:hypothetical protein
MVRSAGLRHSRKRVVIITEASNHSFCRGVHKLLVLLLQERDSMLLTKQVLVCEAEKTLVPTCAPYKIGGMGSRYYLIKLN